MKINFRNNRGFTTVDLSIAMIVVVVFAIIMSSISNSIYSVSMEAKRTAVALNYAVDIFEHIGILNYEDVVASEELFNTSKLKDFEYKQSVNSSGVGLLEGNIGSYQISLQIEDYNSGNVVKLITLRITYPVSKKKTETLEMQRVKAIELPEPVNQLSEAQTVSEPVQETQEPVQETIPAVAEPVSESTPESVPDTVTEPTPESTSDPVTEPIPESVPESNLESGTESTDEPVAQETPDGNVL